MRRTTECLFAQQLFQPRQQGIVCRQPVYAFKLVRTEPAEVGMFAYNGNLPVQIHGKTVHCKMKIGIIVLHRKLFAVSRNGYAQLLFKLPCKRGGGYFALLYLSAGKFPKPFKCAVSPLRGKHFSAADEHCRGNAHGIHYSIPPQQGSPSSIIYEVTSLSFSSSP